MGAIQTQIAVAAKSPETSVVRIEVCPGCLALDPAELWAYRAPVNFLVSRDKRTRYKHIVIGAPWAVLQTTTAVLVFSIFFGNLPNQRSARLIQDAMRETEFQIGNSG
jgi:hypothetical protein